MASFTQLWIVHDSSYFHLDVSSQVGRCSQETSRTGSSITAANGRKWMRCVSKRRGLKWNGGLELKKRAHENIRVGIGAQELCFRCRVFYAYLGIVRLNVGQNRREFPGSYLLGSQLLKGGRPRAHPGGGTESGRPDTPLRANRLHARLFKESGLLAKFFKFGVLPKSRIYWVEFR